MIVTNDSFRVRDIQPEKKKLVDNANQLIESMCKEISKNRFITRLTLQKIKLFEYEQQFAWSSLICNMNELTELKIKSNNLQEGQLKAQTWIVDGLVSRL